MLYTSENHVDRSSQKVLTSAPTVEIHTLRDAHLDERRERFFEGVERLIFSDRATEARKAQVLRRYASRLAARGEVWTAEQAQHLAEVYDQTMRQFR